MYRPPSQNLAYFLGHISNLMDYYSNIEKCMVIGDFNCEPDQPLLKALLQAIFIVILNVILTCFKFPEGSCIDFILSNQKHGLQKTGTIDTGLSDFHHLVYTQLKSKFSRLPPKRISIRSYSNFNSNNFLTELSLAITSSNIQDYELFSNIFVKVLDKHGERETPHEQNP